MIPSAAFSRTTSSLCAVLTTSIALAPALAFAARPMITDDARIVDAKSCQVESWVRTNHGSREYWALPGCNFTGNLEITVGGAMTRTGEGRETSDVVMQGKTLFKTLQPNGWSIGLAAGNVRHPNQDTRFAGDLYAYVPASFSFADDRFVLHTNVGIQRVKASGDTYLTLGVGSETQIASNTWVIAESFRQLDSKPFFQAGVRHWIVPNRVQIDATYGNRFGAGNDQRWFSVGLRLLSPAFLP